MGELMAGQFEKYYANGSGTGLTDNYWLLTPYNESNVRSVYNYGAGTFTDPSNVLGVRPSLNLKSNVIITSGDGTLQNPFEIALQ